MGDISDYERIPDLVSPSPLPDVEYEDLKKIEQIGTGGDADVYRAVVKFRSETHTVAVKEPRFDATVTKNVVKRFQTEAETWGKLDDHDNIVSVYGWNLTPSPWLILEYMDGGTLAPHLGSMEVGEALWIAGRIAEGVQHGHQHGIAHLDLKPSNVLLRDTPSDQYAYPKVSDWGLAKLLLNHSQTVDGLSPEYAAPEQFDSDEFGPTDNVTDIYQLGAIIYALFTGRPPFVGSPMEIMNSVLTETPDPPSEHNRHLPQILDKIVLKALAKKKSRRYESVILLRRHLDTLFNKCIGSEIIDTELGESGQTHPATSQPGTTSRVTNDKTTATDETDSSPVQSQTTKASGAKRNRASADQQVSSQPTNTNNIVKDRKEIVVEYVSGKRNFLLMMGGAVGIGVLGNNLLTSGNTNESSQEASSDETTGNSQTAGNSTELYEASPGEAVSTTDHLLIEPAVEFRRSVVWSNSIATTLTPDPPHYNYRKLFHAPSGRFLVVLKLLIENTGTEAIDINPNAFELPETTFYDDLPGTDLQHVSIEGQSAINTDSITVTPSEQTQIWYLGQCSETNGSDPASLTYTPPDSNDPRIEWDIDGNDGLPEFQIESISAPDQVTEGEQFELQVSVSNTGNGGGRFQGIVEDNALDDYGDFNWYESEEASIALFDAEIEPGNTVNFSSTCALGVSGIGGWSADQLRFNSFENNPIVEL